MRVTFTRTRPIQYGFQVKAVSDDASVIADFYAESKKKTLTVKPGGDRGLADLIAANAERVKKILLTGGGPWSLEMERETPREESGAIRIWSDGGSRPNPGPGGFGAIIRYPDGRETEVFGYEADTTNNRMELGGVIRALEVLGETTEELEIILDSSYVMQGITSWINGWKKKGWKTAAGKDVLNRDLWERLDRLTSERSIRWTWVKGHSGHTENERCDRLATKARRERSSGKREV